MQESKSKGGKVRIAIGSQVEQVNDANRHRSAGVKNIT